MSEPAPGSISPQPEPELQFRRAVPIEDAAKARCAVCQMPIAGAYYHAAGRVVCPACAQRIQQGQQAAPHVSLLKAFLYGGAAAFAGFAIYAFVAIVLNMEIGLMSILVGYMVGKAIRYACGGAGGRPQQILAVLLTYFAITTSYIPVFIYGAMQKHPAAEQSASPSAPQSTAEDSNSRMSFGAAAGVLLLLAAAAPFLGLAQGASGILTLLIVFFGLSAAWRLTGRTDILVMGPYDSSPGPA